METITGTPVEWDEVEDRDIWRQFLSTRTGQRLIAKALDYQPSLLAGGNTNEIFIRSGECRGWTAAFSTIIMLATGEPKLPDQEAPTVYPRLDDDAAWNDGRKVVT